MNTQNNIKYFNNKLKIDAVSLKLTIIKSSTKSELFS